MKEREREREREREYLFIPHILGYTTGVSSALSRGVFRDEALYHH